MRGCAAVPVDLQLALPLGFQPAAAHEHPLGQVHGEIEAERQRVAAAARGGDLDAVDADLLDLDHRDAGPALVGDLDLGAIDGERRRQAASRWYRRRAAGRR